MQETGKRISRARLRQKLTRAAQVRSVISMISVVPAIMIFCFAIKVLEQVFGKVIDDEDRGIVGAIGLVAFFGVFLLVSWLLTKFYCKKAVLCPNCGGSLWQCGTGNFKPRRMRVRDDAFECPHCHAEFL